MTATARLGYAVGMTFASGPARPSETADTDGLPAAFAKGGAPYTLEDLLAGLPAVGDDGTPVRTPAPPPPDDGNASAPANADPEPQWRPDALTQGNLVAALSALAEDGDGAPPDHSRTDTGATADMLAARVEEIIAAHRPAGTPALDKGDRHLPDNLDALALLLADPPPAGDFPALDALYACWPKHTHDCDSRALLAVAQNLSRSFGLPGKLPMASAKAWRMLSPLLFEAELAQQLAETGRFITEWQQTQRTFLMLEFSEIDLIEYLFEALPPATHTALLTEVMNFKVLSNRRLGLLRRIPIRLKKQIAPMLPAGKQQALAELAHAKALLEHIATSTGFAPIIDTAMRARDDIDKMMKAASPQ